MNTLIRTFAALISLLSVSYGAEFGYRYAAPVPSKYVAGTLPLSYVPAASAPSLAYSAAPVAPLAYSASPAPVAPLAYSASPAPAPLTYAAAPSPLGYAAPAPAAISSPQLKSLGPIAYSAPFPSAISSSQLKSLGPIAYSAPVPSPISPQLKAYPSIGYASPTASIYAAPAPPLPPAAAYAPSYTKYNTEVFATPGLSKSEIRDDYGQYSLSYVTGNGIRVTERSYLKPSASGGYAPTKEGTYEYISPEGIPVSYGYKADENGYNVKGFPLPIAPSAN
jgi:hypothetical protein